jgi:hypothetical protein
MPVAPAHNQSSIDLVERYATKICYIGINIDSATLFSPLALRTTLLSKGEGVLGSYPNLLRYFNNV